MITLNVLSHFHPCHERYFMFFFHAENIAKVGILVKEEERMMNIVSEKDCLSHDKVLSHPFFLAEKMAMFSFRLKKTEHVENCQKY